MPGWLLAIFIIGGIVFFLALIIPPIFRAAKKAEIRDTIQGLANNEIELTPEQFFKMRNKSFGGQGRPKYSLNHDFAGVYILYNKTKNMYYVGQAQNILRRVNNHFTGKGNGDVYADYKYGDEFTIKMIALEKSKYSSLNELERHTIMAYDAFATGYNKTRGNM